METRLNGVRWTCAIKCNKIAIEQLATVAVHSVYLLFIREQSAWRYELVENLYFVVGPRPAGIHILQNNYNIV